MDSDADLDDYISVGRFCDRTGLNKHLIYKLLRRGAIDGFQLAGTTKWVIHKHAHHALRPKKEG